MVTLPADVARLQAQARRLTTPMATGEIVWHAWGVPRAGVAPLVLLHGGSGSWTHWLRNIDTLLAEGRELWVPDLPGFGDSAPPPGGHDADAMVAPLHAGLQALLGAQPCDLVGFSFGGMVAGLPAYVTNQLDAKTGTPDKGRVIAGDFSQIVIGEWGVTEILANPYAAGYYEKGDVQLRIMHTMDAVVRHPKAFVVADDLGI